MRNTKSGAFSVVFEFLKVNFKERMIFPLDFVLGALLLALSKAAGLVILLVAGLHVESIAGYSIEEILLIYGLSQCCFALWTSVAINTITIPFYLMQGRMDRFLLRPFPAIAQVLLDGFDEDAWGELFLGIGVVAISIHRMEIPVTASLLLTLASSVFLGGMIYVGLSIAVGAISFWIPGNHQLHRLVYLGNEFAHYPLTIFPRAGRFILSWVIPIAFTGYRPARMLLGEIPTLPSLAAMAGMAAVVLAVALIAWTQGLRRYESTGS